MTSLRFATLAVGLVVLGAAGTANAYPQWQFSSGTSRCSQCHYSPAGGGIIKGYARDAVGEDLSTWEGNGGFLHGVLELPKAVALQFDGRGAVMGADVGETRGLKQFIFPMQADLAARVGFTDSVSAVAVVGYRGQARSEDVLLGAGAAQPAGASRFISREHYLMWQPEAKGAYARVGRFFAPYGLRMAEHYTYIRRDTGSNLLEESYNVSGGYLETDWELHVTAFVPDFVRKLGANDKGLAGLFEYRLGEATAAGASFRAGVGDAQTRVAGGLFGKSYFEGPVKTLVQAEVDLIHSAFKSGKAAAYASQGFVGYLGVSVFPMKGLWVTPFVERHQTDIKVRDSATNAAGLQLNWFPYPHFEISWMLRAQMPAAGTTAKAGVFILHYYL